jgi:CheY-like chemotaxis protein
LTVHILAADDDRVTREILLRSITSEPRFSVDVVKDGVEAWAHLENPASGFDACFLDIHMPGMDGFEVLAKIREHATLNQMPVILCTTSNDSATVKRALGFAVFGYLVKPCGRTQVLAKLYQLETFLRAKGRLFDRNGKALGGPGVGGNPKPSPQPSGKLPATPSLPPAAPPPRERKSPGAPSLFSAMPWAQNATPIEGVGSVCARLRITIEAYRILVRMAVRDVYKWTIAVRTVTNRADVVDLEIRAKELAETCVNLGLHLQKPMAAAQEEWKAGNGDNSAETTIVPLSREVLQEIESELVATLEELGPLAPNTGPAEDPSVVALPVRSLQARQVLVLDAKSRSGVVLVRAGMELDAQLLGRLRNLAKLGDVCEPIFVSTNEAAAS